MDLSSRVKSHVYITYTYLREMTYVCTDVQWHRYPKYHINSHTTTPIPQTNAWIIIMVFKDASLISIYIEIYKRTHKHTYNITVLLYTYTQTHIPYIDISHTCATCEYTLTHIHSYYTCPCTHLLYILQSHSYITCTCTLMTTSYTQKPNTFYFPKI